MDVHADFNDLKKLGCKAMGLMTYEFKFPSKRQ